MLRKNEIIYGRIEKIGTFNITITQKASFNKLDTIIQKLNNVQLMKN
jgi:hypothetical protein